MKYLGIDYGEKRVGIAVSDADGLMAFPKTVLTNTITLLPTIKDIIASESVGAIVVGESTAHDGSDNPIMRAARQFAEDLRQETGLSVHFEPEFYSSSEARMLKDQTGNTGETIDAEAAAVILNSYIARARMGDS